MKLHKITNGFLDNKILLIATRASKNLFMGYIEYLTSLEYPSTLCINLETYWGISY